MAPHFPGRRQLAAAQFRSRKMPAIGLGCGPIGRWTGPDLCGDAVAIGAAASRESSASMEYSKAEVWATTAADQAGRVVCVVPGSPASCCRSAAAPGGCQVPRQHRQSQPCARSPAGAVGAGRFGRDRRPGSRRESDRAEVHLLRMLHIVSWPRTPRLLPARGRRGCNRQLAGYAFNSRPVVESDAVVPTVKAPDRSCGHIRPDRGTDAWVSRSSAPRPPRRLPSTEQLRGWRMNWYLRPQPLQTASRPVQNRPAAKLPICDGCQRRVRARSDGELPSRCLRSNPTTHLPMQTPVDLLVQIHGDTRVVDRSPGSSGIRFPDALSTPHQCLDGRTSPTPGLDHELLGTALREMGRPSTVSGVCLPRRAERTGLNPLNITELAQIARSHFSRQRSHPCARRRIAPCLPDHDHRTRHPTVNAQIGG